MEQLLCHLFGDFALQTDWMAMNKSKKSFNCLVHVLIYTACFLLITTSWKALLVIGITHFILDRWHFILRRLIWLKNHFPLGYPPYAYCNTTGYYDDSPYNTNSMVDYINHFPNGKHWILTCFGKPRHFFITIWIYIVIDNLCHLTINYLAIKYL